MFVLCSHYCGFSVAVSIFTPTVRKLLCCQYLVNDFLLSNRAHAYRAERRRNSHTHTSVPLHKQAHGHTHCSKTKPNHAEVDASKLCRSQLPHVCLELSLLLLRISFSINATFSALCAACFCAHTLSGSRCILSCTVCA